MVKPRLAPQIEGRDVEPNLGRNQSQGSFLSCPEIRKQVRHKVHSMCSTISDSEIINCNRGFWIRNGEDEARNIWDAGKLLGVTFSGEDREIISRLVTMEKRDESEMVGLDSGASGDDQDGFLWLCSV